MDKNSLKKNHFWILAGVVPLLVLIAVLVVSSSVGSAIEEQKKKIDGANNELKNKSSPKPVDLIKKVEAQNETLGVTRGELWQANWDRQKSQFKWPDHPVLKAIEAQNLKFGVDIPKDEDSYGEFSRRELYLAQFSNARPGFPGTGMADLVAPTQFNGSWQRVLRHVADGNWGDTAIQSDQIWLALEDIWVQRALLGAVKTVNDQIARFDRVPLDPASPSAPDNKLRRRFVSPTWEVELWTEPRADGKTVLRGKLTNTTDRLQLLGVGNTMTLRVWFEDTTRNPKAPYFDYRIGTEFLPGKGAKKEVKKDKGVTEAVDANVLDVVPTEAHELPSINLSEIYKVEQIFDARTVPVRRIDRIVLGQLDARNAAATLKKTESMQKADEAKATATTTGGGEGGSGSGPPEGMVMGGRMPGAGGPGGATGVGTMAAGREGGGPPELVLDGQRARYLEVSPNVRRMPVGIVLVIDQAYLQDVLIAYANSPLRFQITQVHWQRFRGQLQGVGSTGGSTGSEPGGGVVMSSGRGVIGMGGLQGEEEEGRRPSPGIRPGPGGMAGRMMMGMMTQGPPGGGMLTTVSESQLTAGLIEVSIYGIISLYEKYETEAEKKAAEEKAAEAKKAADEKKEAEKKEAEKTADPKETPKGTDPKEKEVDPKATDPKGTEPKKGETEPKGKPGS